MIKLYGLPPYNTDDTPTDADIANERENKAWREHISKLLSMKEKAQDLEKEGKVDDAIEVYRQAYFFAQKHRNLRYVNYGPILKRLLMIYRKRGQDWKELAVLEKLVVEETRRKDLQEYKKRRIYLMDKLNILLKK